jgi:hypothetical protein
MWVCNHEHKWYFSSQFDELFHGIVHLYIDAYMCSYVHAGLWHSRIAQQELQSFSADHTIFGGPPLAAENNVFQNCRVPSSPLFLSSLSLTRTENATPLPTPPPAPAPCPSTTARARRPRPAHAPPELASPCAAAPAPAPARAAARPARRPSPCLRARRRHPSPSPPCPHVADRPHAVRPRAARPPACPPLHRRRRAATSREGNFFVFYFLFLAVVI